MNTNEKSRLHAGPPFHKEPPEGQPYPKKKPNPHTMKTQQEQDRMILDSAPTDQPLNDIELAALERERDREATATPAQASHNCQTSHSPLPWHLSAYHQHKVVARSRGDATICDCTNPVFRDLVEQESNAAFIVHACNNVQRLADALTKVLDVITGDQAAELGIYEALAQWKESPADADALEALDQLEQLEGGE